MTAAKPQRHLVDVWNPAYASDAMTAHVGVLLEAARRWNSRETETETEPYVWWGKVRSLNRQQGLKHLPQVLEIAAELAGDEARECHLYLTDYRSLYVGHVDEIAADDVRLSDREHVPAYYAEGGLECDFWYKLLDIRRLVADDTPVVIAKLKALRNLGYNDRPVSLYGGMVDLPLVVYRPDQESFFDPDDRSPIRDDRLWAEVDAEARTFIASGEDPAGPAGRSGVRLRAGRGEPGQGRRSHLQRDPEAGGTAHPAGAAAGEDRGGHD